MQVLIRERGVVKNAQLCFSTISRMRRLIDLDTHGEVFGWVLGVLADRGLLQGRRIGIDATTLEANVAMRSIVRRDTGESYEEFLRGLAKASGIDGELGPVAREVRIRVLAMRAEDEGRIRVR